MKKNKLKQNLDMIPYEFLNNDNFQDLMSEMENSKYFTQDLAFLHLLSGKNYFISGYPGTGKSYLIKQYIKYLKKYFPEKSVYVTSTTGISAVNLEGTTIHKYIGLLNSNMTYEEHCKNKKISYYWKSSDLKIKSTDVLIIDEISMLSSDNLEFIYKRLLNLYRTHKIQIILIGDFCQLPPVANNKKTEEVVCYNNFYWKKMNLNTIFLEKSYRANDEQLNSLLKNIINNNINSSLDIIKHISVTNNVDNLSGVILTSTKEKMENFNKTKQRQNPEILFKLNIDCSDKKIEEKRILNIATKLNIASESAFKNGDIVMITNNQVNYYKENSNSPDLANGFIGKIYKKNNEIIFLYKGQYKYYIYPMTVYVDKNDDVKMSVLENLKDCKFTLTYYPITLSYATTIHKSQGQTLSDVVVDLSNCWMPNLGYVALSRAKSIDGITLIKHNNSYISKQALEINEYSLAILDDIKKNSILLKNNDNEIQSIFIVDKKK